jgi:succinoglycan biosynthesis protein ExoM
MKCSVCINTYKRPELLKKLLESINVQQFDKNIMLEIIVVDNDQDQSAKFVVSNYSLVSKFPVKYFIQPKKNISLARNKAVSEAGGEYILFIDDDEYADNCWIINSAKCLIKFNADAVFGSVIPYYDDETPDWIKSNSFFQKQTHDTGTKPRFTRTSNCLIKTSIIKSIEGPFDPKYGLTGGSDTHLFSILSKNGAKFISCKESIVYEYIPPDRANIKWLLKRSLRTGNSYARRNIEFAKIKLLSKIYLTLKALILGLYCLIMACLNFFSLSRRNVWLIKAVGYWGHILAVFENHFVEYK